MGTTLDAIKSDSEGFRYVWSVTIEGYQNILTDGDTDAMVTAFAATDWTAALPGLEVDYSERQEIDPWSSAFKPTQCRFFVTGSLTQDTFGEEVFRSDSGNEALQNESADCDATIISALDNSSFSASGDAYLGTECFTYSGTTSNDFNSITRGKYAPFKAESEASQRFARDHSLPSTYFDVSFRPVITSQPRKWQGRHVAVRIHRVVGSTIDVVAQSHLVFAGTIADVADTGARTQVSCVDFRAQLNNHVVLSRQWQGQVPAGVWLDAGSIFYYGEVEDEHGIGQGHDAADMAASSILTVVASGASGAREMNEGYITADELVDTLNTWLNDASTTGPVRAFIKPTFKFGGGGGGSGRACYMEWRVEDDTTMKIYMNGPEIAWRMLGFEDFVENSAAHLPGSSQRHSALRGEKSNSSGSDVLGRLTAPGEPWAAIVFSIDEEDIGVEVDIDIDGVQGEWVDMGESLPGDIRAEIDDDANLAQYSLVQIGNFGIALARPEAGETGAITKLERLATQPNRVKKYGKTVNAGDRAEIGIRESEGSNLVIRQVLALEGELKTVLANLFLSTGTADYNHDTYDTYGIGVGAGIPWEVLGDDFLNSLDALQSTTKPTDVVYFINKPTALANVIGPDLLLRMGHLVFHEGNYRFTQSPSASAATSVATLTESTKGSPSEQGTDAQMATTERSSRFMRNVVSIKYNRDAEGKYRNTTVVKHETSIREHGESKPVTISVPSIWGDDVAGTDDITVAKAELVANLLPLFGVPITLHTRTLNRSHFDLVPGDVVTVTDTNARNLTTGVRGLSTKPGWIMDITRDWGVMTSSATIVFDDADRLVTYSPCADVDDGAANGGYDAAGTYLTVKANSFSLSSEADDVTHFEAGDVIDIFEVDIPSPGTPNEWQRTIDTVTAGTHRISLTSGLSSPAWDSTKKYRIQSAEYSAAQSSQQTHAYQADDADMQIENSLIARRFASAVGFFSWTDPDATTQPERTEHGAPGHLWAGDGSPITPAHAIAPATLLNNYMHYKWAAQLCYLRPEAANAWGGNGTGNWQLAQVMPVFFPRLQGGKTYYFNVAPVYCLDQDFTPAGGESVGVRISLTTSLPTHGKYGDGLDTENCVFPGVRDYVEFSTTSTTWQLPTAKQIKVPRRGLNWLVIEFASSDTFNVGEGDYGSCWYLGLCEAWLGPPE